MKDLLDRLTALGKRLAEAEKVLKLSARREEIATLESLTTAEDFWSDRAAAELTLKSIGEQKKFIEPWETVESELTDLHELAGSTAPDDHASIGQLAEELSGLERRFGELEFALLMNGEFDDHSAILSVYAGAGGTDAQDWAQMLLTMIERFAASLGFACETLHVSQGEEAGIKSATVKISGPFAYGYLKSENGVHRLVRMSPFDADHARHTSFALIDIVPDIGDELDIELDPGDLKVDVFRSSGAGGQSVNTTDSAVRITHLPTGITVSVQNERSQLQNKTAAMGILKTRLFNLMRELKAERLEEIRGERPAAEWGSQIRSYVLHPYTKVKDHRTGYETSQTEKVLAGELLPFVEAYLRWST